MNGLPPLGHVRRRASEHLDRIRKDRFWKDRLSLGLLIAGLVVSLLNFISLVGKVHPSELLGAVRFSSLDLGYTLGVWYYPYLVALFGLGVVVVNGTLAYQTFGRSRLASFCLLAGGVVVAIFAFIISNALGAAR